MLIWEYLEDLNSTLYSDLSADRDSPQITMSEVELARSTFPKKLQRSIFLVSRALFLPK